MAEKVRVVYKFGKPIGHGTRHDESQHFLLSPRQILFMLTWWMHSNASLSSSRVPPVGGESGTATNVSRRNYFCSFEQWQITIRLWDRTSLKGPGQIAHLAQIGRQIGYAGFHSADMIVWLAQIRFLKFDKTWVPSGKSFIFWTFFW